MSIPSKWNMERKMGRWLIFRESDGVFVCEIQSEANAKRICQTHNSHDGLLEACKSMIKSLQKDRLTMYVNFQVRKQMREAIAQAEE